jgi:hypothetical protein
VTHIIHPEADAEFAEAANDPVSSTPATRCDRRGPMGSRGITRRTGMTGGKPSSGWAVFSGSRLPPSLRDSVVQPAFPGTLVRGPGHALTPRHGPMASGPPGCGYPERRSFRRSRACCRKRGFPCASGSPAATLTPSCPDWLLLRPDVDHEEPLLARSVPPVPRRSNRCWRSRPRGWSRRAACDHPPIPPPRTGARCERRFRCFVRRWRRALAPNRE